MKFKQIISSDLVINRILLFRGQKVILDRDLASLYQVETRVLKQAVRRNINRFPSDFMFQLNKKEFETWKSQIVMSDSDKIGLRHLPFAFSEQGVAMLSSVLNSERAIEINIIIIRAFVKLREIISSNYKIEQKIKDLEAKLSEQDDQIIQIFNILNQLVTPPELPKKKMGFLIE